MKASNCDLFFLPVGGLYILMHLDPFDKKILT